MKLDDSIARSEEIVARDVGGETVLLDLAGGTYYGLNAVGGQVWKLLEDQPRRLAEICAALLEDYDAAPEVIEADVLALAEDLLANGLVQSV